MVRLLAELPPELRVHVADMCAASTAGQLAQTDRACAALCSTRLAVLWAAHVQALSNAAALELQQAFATRAASALLEVNDMGGSQLAIRVVTRDAQLRASTTQFAHASAVASKVIAHAASALQICCAISHQRRIGPRTASVFTAFPLTLLHGMPS